MQSEVVPLFRRVEDVKTFIANHSPREAENVSLELCVVKAKDLDKCGLLDLLDEGIEQRVASFEDVSKCYNMINDQRRSRGVFELLAVWKTGICYTVRHSTPGHQERSYRVDGACVVNDETELYM
ncbi:hypothetical protein PI125_g18100 [Phytophthora idaei]|nr:hypothetical protein PI125_g18100 [Phytophthora idaei]